MCIRDRYSVTLTATTTDSAKYSAPKEIDARTAQLDLPQGVSFGVGMMDESTAEGLESMATAIAAGIFLVFLVMAIQFDSPRLSIMVMMCIPLSLIGSIGLVFLNGRPMSIVGLMGFLMLVGIAVNNGIYLVDGTNQLRQTMPLGDALVEAGTTRLRPILMTTLTTIISMVPMIFSNDSGMSMMKDMAYVMAVSYTHLDVYKRQRPCPSPFEMPLIYDCEPENPHRSTVRILSYQRRHRLCKG